ncbi:MAG: sensor histidine kinase [Gammaproteobacteria bacterium]|nr:sensor histidine kinase [Gammaproteobacteria bacterium]
MTPKLIDRRALVASLLALAVMVVAFLAAFTWLQYRMMAVHDQQMSEALQRELLVRQQLDRQTGRDELIQSLTVRNELFPKSRYFVLIDPTGKILVGSPDRVRTIEGLLRTQRGVTRMQTPDGGNAFLASIRLDDGAFFALYQGDAAREEIARSLGRAALISIVLLILVGLVTGLVLNRYVLGHVSNLADTARQIMRGQMTARAPVQQRLDAMGALTSTFNEMLEQNEALVSGMRTVTESLAHDLRTPLMRAQRAIAAARVANTALEQEAHLQRAEQDMARALQTFNALVDLARAEAGLSRDSMERIDLASLATDLAELFEPLAEERGQRIERHIVPTAVFGHRQILAQALGNLLENAIKYSAPNSVLRLRVRPGETSDASEIVVEDAGPGIPPNAREQAMRPFVRLETAQEVPGAGMGLAIAAAVARLHRGRLILENAEPGLRVRLQLSVPQTS